MSGLVVIVPSRGRPHAVGEMAEAFRETCTADTQLIFAVDSDDPTSGDYLDAAKAPVAALSAANTSMVHALNRTAMYVATGPDPLPRAVAFMGDDHRPRTRGWDAAYLDALAARPGLVYGNDLHRGEKLPTQAAMSAEVVRALGHMAPPPLTHLYVDNYWRDLGQAAGCITYLPDVVVEHMHPVVRKAEWDEGYRRVNDPLWYQRDRAAYRAYWAENRERDVAAVRSVLAAGGC